VINDSSGCSHVAVVIRVTICMESMEMSGILTAVRELSGVY